MARVFTDHIVRTLKVPPGPAWAEHSDGGCKGLRIRISPRGDRVWSLLTRIGGKRHRHELGAYPSVSLAEARDRARQFMAAARDGTTPSTVERRQKVANMTVVAAHAEYLAAVGPKLRATTLSLKRRMFEMHVAARLGDRPIVQVRRAELVDLADRLTAMGLQAQVNRVLAEVMALLRWAADRDWIEAVPSVGKSVRIKERPRGRTLTDPEIIALWTGTERVTETVRDYLRLLLLTGQRTEEVRGAEWAEFDLEAGLWTIPPSRYKTKIAHVVPLSAPVLDILKRRQLGSPGNHVLPGRDPAQAWNGEKNAADQIRKQMPAVPHFVFHDLRRTVRTGLVRLPGVSNEVAEAVIGHAKRGLDRVYDHHDRLDEKRHALDAWAAHVEFLVERSGRSNVVPLHRAAGA